LVPILVHRSNRVEVLADALLAVVSEPLRSPFEPETIIVQSKGMERWLSMFCAQKLGIWANARFPFPKAYVGELNKLFPVADPSANAQVEVPASEVDAFSRPVLAWSIAALLPSLIVREKFAELKRYLEGENALARRLELADRIAQIFDQYVVYRPELVRSFLNGEGDDWQAELWRALSNAYGGGATRITELIENIGRAQVPAQELPGRVSVFGISSLPPIYLEALNALSKHCPVHLFQLSPSREYFGQIRSAKELARLDRTEPAWRTQHLALENPLLASLGRLGRDFQQILESHVEYVEGSSDLYVEPGTSSALQVLQSDILHLTERGQGPEQTSPIPLDRADTSISIHVCHGPIREVEVLRDQLLACFEARSTLEPHAVIVMMPDVEAYAPIIEAVFGVDPAAPGYIPYRIADRSLRACSPAAEAFMALVGVLGGRMKASEVLDVLALPSVQARFELSPADLSQIEHWVFRSGIRWGEDAEHRAREAQPNASENTWRFGLERLFLGWALPSHRQQLFEGVLPLDSVEGAGAEVLGQLAAFCDKLFSFFADFQNPKTPRQWQERLSALQDQMLGTTGSSAADLEFVRQTVEKLVELAELGKFDEAIDLKTIASVLARSFEEQRTHHDFMSGGVTFCALLPMRSIPFRVVCLLGMNDGGFPRTTPRLAFDRMVQKPRLGDRSLGDEDRYLFLEALLAARDALIITYVGRDPHDNKERPPSVVVGELLDAINESFILQPLPGEEQFPASSLFVVSHPLQAFSPRYFQSTNARLFSFGEVEARGAAALSGPRAELPMFQRALLPEAPRPVISLERLVRFFENPAKGYLQDSLGLFLRDEPDLVADREPIDPEALERYQIGAESLERTLAGVSVESGFALAKATGLLPLGTTGRCVYERVADEAQQLAMAARPWVEGVRLEPRHFRLALSGCELEGAFLELWPRAQVLRQFVRVSAKREVAFWIRHLALQCAGGEGAPTQSVLIGRAPDSKTTEPTLRVFRAVERKRARAILNDLVAIYMLGQRLPLRFFPKASKAFIVAKRKHQENENSVELALNVAREAFGGRQSADKANQSMPEGTDLSVLCCFPGEEPISGEPVVLLGNVAAPSFTELAEAIFSPLLEHLETEA